MKFGVLEEMACAILFAKMKKLSEGWEELEAAQMQGMLD